VKLTFKTLLLVLCAFTFKAQTNFNLNFAYGTGSVGYDNLNHSTIDASGNIYITGQFQGSVDFNPGGTAVIKTTVASNGCAFVAKYNSSGILTWVNLMESTYTSDGKKVLVDALTGNVYITGTFEYTLDLTPPASTNTLAANFSDMFIAKYSAAGNFIWAKGIGGAGSMVTPYGADLSSTGDVYISGNFDYPADFDASANTNSLTSNGSFDVFLVKYDATGSYQWAYNFGGSNGDAGLGVAVDASNNVYMTGQFQDGPSFDPAAPSNTITSIGEEDIFIAKYSPSGNYIWAKGFGGTVKDIGYSIKIDAASNIVVSGILQSVNADFDPSAAATYTLSKIGLGTNDFFITKFDLNGNFIWANNTGGDGDVNPLVLNTDAQNNIYIGGRFDTWVDFDMSSAVSQTLTALTLSNYDIFISKYDPQGNFIYANSIGGGSGSGNSAYGLNIDASNNVILTGNFNGILDFDLNAAASYTLPFNFGTDIFIAKYAQCIFPSYATMSTPSATTCSGSQFTLSVLGNLNSAANWVWSTGGCSTSTFATGASIVVSPTVNTEYFVRAEGGCITSPSTCVTSTLTVVPLKSLSGSVTSSTVDPVAGNVIIYKYEPILTKFDSLTYQTLSAGGTYSFNTMQNGSYIIKSVPSANSLQVTYAPSAISWKDAVTVNHGCINNTIQNISVTGFTNIGNGPGVLSGKLTEGVGYVPRGGIFAPGNPIKGMIVKGGRNPGGDIVNQVVTDAAGGFTLSGFPMNTAGQSYFLLVDIPGLDTNSTYYRAIDATNTIYTNLDFVVDSTKINPINAVNSVREVSFENVLVKMFPNPSNGNLTIKLSLKKAEQVAIELTDVQGKHIQTLVSSNFTTGKDVYVTTDLSDIEPGIYFVTCKIGAIIKTEKLILTR